MPPGKIPVDTYIFKSPKWALISQQATILAIIGTQLIHSYVKNSPLWANWSTSEHTICQF